MRVRIEPAEQNDRGVNRIRNALLSYAPDGLEFVDDHTDFDVDLLVVNVNGRCGRTKRRIAKAKSFGADIAIMQISIKSTRNPSVVDWMPVWDQAKVIWSYYDLLQMAIDEGVEPTFANRFYRAPLGADSDVFSPTGAEKKYLALTVSHTYLSESAREVIKAVNKVGGKVAHLGPNFGIDWVDNYHNISDEGLANLYSSSCYVSGLRRIEGQDMPAAEGLLCGARPIVFDRPDQADWYGEFSVVLPETSRAQIVEDLVEVFDGEYDPVRQEEIEKARDVFSWKKFAEGFWSCL